MAAAMAAFSAGVSFVSPAWVVRSMTAYGVPRWWWPWLGALKAAGAAGLLIGLLVPAIGVLAATGLVLYFAGAAVTVIRAGQLSHVPFPLVFVAPVLASLALGLAA
nr:DoxX family protein [Actinopolymorpha pittospori]